MSELLISNLSVAIVYILVMCTVWITAVMAGHGWALGVERGKRKAKKEADNDRVT